MMDIIGKTGVGKTTLILNMALNNILSGEGVGVIDPHGDLAEKLVKHIQKPRRKDLENRRLRSLIFVNEPWDIAFYIWSV